MTSRFNSQDEKVVQMVLCPTSLQRTANVVGGIVALCFAWAIFDSVSSDDTVSDSRTINVGFSDALTHAVPSIFTDSEVRSAAIARAVNHYVTIGEEATLLEFEKLAQQQADFHSRQEMTMRIGWLLRTLYLPKSDPLRSISIGGLSFPPIPEEGWPIFPLVKTGDTIVVLCRDLMLAGTPEPLDDYLNYCREHGDFRTSKVPVPDKERARKDIDDFLKSSRWKALEWDGQTSRNSSYHFNVAQAVKFIQQQANEDRGKSKVSDTEMAK